MRRKEAKWVYWLRLEWQVSRFVSALTLKSLAQNEQLPRNDSHFTIIGEITGINNLSYFEICASIFKSNRFKLFKLVV